MNLSASPDSRIREKEQPDKMYSILSARRGTTYGFPSNVPTGSGTVSDG